MSLQTISRKEAPTAICLGIPGLGEFCFDQPIRYVDHPWFRRRDALRLIDGICPDSVSPESYLPQPATHFVPGLFSQPLLSQDRERFLFLKMNYLRFRAERARAARGNQSARERKEAILADLEEATRLRNLIVEANLRLVIATARKLARSLDQLSELTSDGMLPLCRAAELFDIGLGNRFSTYATWAIRNQLIRTLRRQRPHEKGIELCPEHWQAIEDESTRTQAAIDAPESATAVLPTLLNELTPRERLIIQARFGLDGEPAGQSLAEISKKIGLSKERIRQIAIIAIEKMRLAAHDSSSADFPET